MTKLFHMKCPNPVGTVSNYWKPLEGSKKVACKKWSCPVCSQHIKWQILQRVELNFPKGSEYFFMSLTDHMHPDDISSHYIKFIHILKRKYNVDKYFWCKEFTPPKHAYRASNNEVRMSVGEVKHIHALISFIDEYPTEEEISYMWEKSTIDSYQVKFTKVMMNNPAGYIAKYMDKSFQDEKYMRDENKYQFSRSCIKKEKSNTSSGWSFDMGSPEKLQAIKEANIMLASMVKTKMDEGENLNKYQKFKKEVYKHGME